MGGFSSHNLAFAFGLLGNIISFFVFLSPLPTFYKIHKKKSTAGFQSVPYVVALFSAMLLMYYAFVKANSTLLITINSFGCLIESVYIAIHLFYAPKKIKVQTVKEIALMIGSFGLILTLTHFLAKSSTRVHIVGWICLVFSVSVFAAPLCIVKQVIRTKSVEFMPFSLSFSLTLNAVMWFFYGLLIKDFNIAIPNILGFFFGIIQMGLYIMYKNAKKVVEEPKIDLADQQQLAMSSQVIVLEDPKIDAADQQQLVMSSQVIVLEGAKLPELAEQVIDVVKLGAVMCPELVPADTRLNVPDKVGKLNVAKQITEVVVVAA